MAILEGQVLQRVAAGKSLATIAFELGYTDAKRIQKIRDRGLVRYLKGMSAEQVRAEILARNEALLEKLIPAGVQRYGVDEDGNDQYLISTKILAEVRHMQDQNARLTGAYQDPKTVQSVTNLNLTLKARKGANPTVLDKVAEFMELADLIAESGYGSGRQPVGALVEAQSTSATESTGIHDSDDDPVDAEIVEN